MEEALRCLRRRFRRLAGSAGPAEPSYVFANARPPVEATSVVTRPSEAEMAYRAMHAIENYLDKLPSADFNVGD